MISFAKKLFKRGSGTGKSETTGKQIERLDDNSELQDSSSFTALKVIQLQHKSKGLVSAVTPLC